MASWYERALGVVSDVGGAIVDTVEETVETVVDTVETTVETVVNTAEAVAEGDIGGVWDAAQSAVESGLDAGLGIVSGAAGDAVDAVDWFVDATSEIGDLALETADDYIFDNVDYITGGVLDIDYDDGNFSANVDLGVASAGVSYGEDGFEANASADIGIVSAGVAYEDGGFSAGGSAGLAWGPLPYVEGHVNIDEDGTIDIGGQAQGTIPTPFGVVSGSVEGGYHQLPDGSWGAYGGAEGTLYTPTGVTVSAGGEVSYELEADGDEVFNAGGHAGVGLLGGPSVEVGGEYHSIEDDGTYTEGGSGYVEGQGYGIEGRAEGSYESVTDVDGNTVETYEGSIEGSGYGHEVGAGGNYTENTNADGSSSSSADGWVDVDGLDSGDLMQAAGSYLGDTAGDLLGGAPGAGSVSDTVSDLAGSGDLSEVLTGLAGDSGQSVAEVAGGLAESGNFDDFSSDIVNSEVVEAAADETWDDLLE